MWDEKILKSLQIVGRGVLTYFMKTPDLAHPPFSSFVQPLPLTSLSPPISTLTVLSVMDNMDLHISSLGTLVPVGC